MPDRLECPSCGDELEPCHDITGTSYQCHNLTCLECFEADEIEEATAS